MDLAEWSPPPALLESLATGVDVRAAVDAARADLAATLVAAGRSVEEARAGAEAAVEQIVSGLATGASPAEVSAMARSAADAAAAATRQIAEGRVDTPESALARAIAHGDPTAVALARDIVGLDAGAGGGASEAALTAALSQGGDLADALQAAVTAKEAANTLTQAGAVPMSAADTLAAAMATGGEAASAAVHALIDTLPSDQAHAFTDALVGALGSGSDAGSALASGQSAGTAAAGIDAAGAVPLSDADRLTAALATGADVGEALAAAGVTSGEAGQALSSSLAAGETPNQAVADAHQADDAADEITDLAEEGVSADLLATALATGEGTDALIGDAASAAGAGDTTAADSFVDALIDALENGASLEDALHDADQQAERAAEQAENAQEPLTPAEQLAQALASGEHLEEVLDTLDVDTQDAAQAEAFEQALVHALEGGMDTTAALEAAAETAAAAEQQLAEGTAEPADGPQTPDATPDQPTADLETVETLETVEADGPAETADETQTADEAPDEAPDDALADATADAQGETADGNAVSPSESLTEQVASAEPGDPFDLADPAQADPTAFSAPAVAGLDTGPMVSLLALLDPHGPFGAMMSPSEPPFEALGYYGDSWEREDDNEIPEFDGEPENEVETPDDFEWDTADEDGPDEDTEGGLPLDLVLELEREAAAASVNDTPVLTLRSGRPAYTEGAAAVALAGALTLTDADDSQITRATVTISDGLSDGDLLAFTGTGGDGITGNFDPATGVLTLSGTASLAAYQAALRSVTFRSTSDDPTAIATTRTVTFQVTDADADGAGAETGIAISTIVLTPTADAPVLNAGTSNLAYTENGTAAAIAPTLTLSDADDGMMTGATVTLSNGLTSGDLLAFAGTDTIAGDFNAGTGVLTLSGAASVAAYQAALRSVTYHSTSDAPTATATTRTVTFLITDADSDGTGTRTGSATSTISVTPTNDAPVLTADAGSLAYTENWAAAAIAPSLTLSDADDSVMTGATVTLSNGLTSGDLLAFTSTATISGSFNPGTGVLTLTGTDSVAAYQAALRSVTYHSTSDAPTATAATRAVTFQVTDADAEGAGTQTGSASRTIAVTATNDTPTLTTVNTLTDATEDTAYTISYATLAAAADEADVDGDTLSFRIEAVSSGTLTKNGSAVSAGITTLAGGESLVWTPDADANGTLNAFSVVARDPADATSTTPVQVQVSVTAKPDIVDQYALIFDGDYDYITADAPLTSADHLTIETWIKTTRDDGYLGIVDHERYVDSTTRYGYKLVSSDGKARLDVSFGTANYSVTGTTSLADGAWHHLAAIYDGTAHTLKIMVDGTVENQVTNAGIGTLSNLGTTITIADDADPLYDGDRYFEGAIADVRIWTTDRTAAVSADANQRLTGSETGLAAYWRLNEGSGTTVDDGTSNNHDGTITDATWLALDRADVASGDTYRGLILGATDGESPPQLSYAVTEAPASGLGSVTLDANTFVYLSPATVGTPTDVTFEITADDGTATTSHTYTMHVT